jgi:hypothetical protein
MRYKLPHSTSLLAACQTGCESRQIKNFGVAAHTVGELRKLKAWPENLVITPPDERRPESAVKVSKASVAARASPKRKHAGCSPGPGQWTARAHHMTGRNGGYLPG